MISDISPHLPHAGLPLPGLSPQVQANMFEQRLAETEVSACGDRDGPFAVSGDVAMGPRPSCTVSAAHVTSFCRVPGESLFNLRGFLCSQLEPKLRRQGTDFPSTLRGCKALQFFLEAPGD